MFKPKGKDPVWKLVYNGIKDLPVGTLVTFGELSDMMDEDSTVYRSPIYKASKALLKNQHRELQSEKNEGYRIVEGMDIVSIAEGRHKRAKRTVNMANFEMNNIDTIKLTADERKKVQDLMHHNANIRAAFFQNAKAIEAGVQATRTQLTGVEAQLAGAQITQLFTETQVRKLKDLLGAD